MSIFDIKYGIKNISLFFFIFSIFVFFGTTFCIKNMMKVKRGMNTSEA